MGKEGEKECVTVRNKDEYVISWFSEYTSGELTLI